LITYRAGLDVPRVLVLFVSRLLARHRRETGTRKGTRSLGCYRQALERAVREGTPYVILDGKIVASDRCHEKTASRKGREIDLWYSGEQYAPGQRVRQRSS
jgi:hypothetical protein